MKITIDLADFRKNYLYAILKAYVRERPGCTVSQIASATGLSYSACSRRIKDLEEAGIISIKRLDANNPHSWVEGVILNESNSRN